MHSRPVLRSAQRAWRTSVLLPLASALLFASAAHAAALAITTKTLPAATGGVAYDQPIVATGGTTPYKWSVQSGSPPPGVALEATTGHLAGTPQQASWIYSYPFASYVKVTDAVGATAYASLTVNVLAPAGGGTTTPPSSGGGTTTTPQQSTYTVTVINGTIGSTPATTASFAPYATVTINAGTPPAGQWFKQWNTSTPVANSYASTTTFTMPYSNVTLTASFYTPQPVPQPVTDHPRLWINRSDVAALQARAIPGNAVYQNLLSLLNTCVANYNNQWFPGGSPAASNPDFGDTQGYTGLLTEQNALVFALFSLIDPSPAARIVHAQRARNIIMLAMNEAAKGHAAGAPFRDPMFALFNRANFTSECWPLAVDWIYNATDANGNPILTPADKKTIRDVFMIWANDCLNAYVCGGDHPSPIGTTNSTALLPGGGAHRTAANNYYSGHARLITLMSLAIDPIDDPAVNPAAPVSVAGNSLRSYIPNATGAWLYQQFAMFGDPAAVQAAYNLPTTAKVGLASGGLSPEGGLYGHAFSYTLGQMLALKTAGFADPAISGPQAALVSAPVWDRYLTGFANSIVPAAKVYPSQSYLGPIYQMASYGDVLRLWITPDFMQVFALKNLLDHKNGNSANDAATRWFAVNAVEGGAAALASRIAQPWSYGVQNSVLYFLLLDPTQAPAADPRPAYSNQFYDAGNGRILARTDWTPGASIFTYRASWENINHQDCDGGQFELYRKGEFLTKEFSTYDNNGNGQSSMWHNTLTLQNWCANGKPTNIQFFENPYWPNGSQWNNGANAGDPVTVSSFGPGYTYAQSDLTKLYNRPDQFTAANSAVDIQHASRSIVSLGSDVVVVYDRATSLHNGFKRFNLNTATPPVIDAVNRVARASTAGGQRIFLQTLAPATATISYVPEAGTLTNIAGLETMTGRLVVEDTSRPLDVRYLHVVNGADATATAPVAASVVNSSAGTSYTGALVGTTVVLFPVNLTPASTGTSYSVPATTVKQIVTGLTPNAGYTITADSDGTTAQLVITPGGSATADAAGVLAFDLPSVL